MKTSRPIMTSFKNSINNLRTIVVPVLLFILLLTVFGGKEAWAGSTTFTTSGTWSAPAGVTSVTVKAWGGGGAGGPGNTKNAGGGGGGGGGEFRQATVTVNPGSSYSVVVGAGGTSSTGANGGSGSPSTFNSTNVVANGGLGGVTGSGGGTGGSGGSGGTGTTGYSGGTGADGTTGSTGVGGGGGEGSGSTTNGNNGSGQTGGTGTDGGDGGAGGKTNATGGAGSTPGGGGGGGGNRTGGAMIGGDGADGQVELTWTEPPVVTTEALSSVSYTSASANGTIVSAGAGTVTRRGFAYILGTSGNPTTTDTVIYEDGSFSTGSYVLSMSGLSVNTSYRVRAYAVNSDGTGYGDTVDLTTLAYSAPTVTTQAVQNKSYTSGSAYGYLQF